MIVMDNLNNEVIDGKYCIRENYAAASHMFNLLKEPRAITIDGNISIIRAIKKTWPDTLIQRCLVHVQRQGLSWLRRYPKSRAAKELRSLLLNVTCIRNHFQKNSFIAAFNDWEDRYGRLVLSLPSKDKVYGDLQRTRSLIIHALPDMFHYLNDPHITPTTNKVEGYFSRLKNIYRQHRGLSKKHRESYFRWYIHYHNIEK